MATAIGRLGQALHIVSAYWVLLLAVLIGVDVVGRSFFNAPLVGTPEFIKNSIVSITFLQLPLAIYRGSMIHTTAVHGIVSPEWRRSLRAFGYLLGLLLFVGIAFSSWGQALDAFWIGEYEGEGSLRVPTWPVRFVVVATSAFAAVVYGYLCYRECHGSLEAEDTPAA